MAHPMTRGKKPSARMIGPILAGLLPLHYSCAPGAQESSGGPSQRMEDFTMTQTESGRTVWKLSSPRADILAGGDADLDSPEILFFRAGRHTSTARSKKARVFGATRDVRMEGEVVIVGHEEKTTLKTAWLDYSAAAKRFKTEAEVFVESPDAKLRGRGLEADSALSDITIFDQETHFQ